MHALLQRIPRGNPTIVEASLTPVTSQWVPVEDASEKQLIDRLVSEGRSFIKGLRYNLGSGSALTYATLIDCKGTARSLYIVPSIPANAASPYGLNDRSMVTWLWNPSCEPIPRLPDKRAQHP
jgi:hypothetical protein